MSLIYKLLLTDGLSPHQGLLAVSPLSLYNLLELKIPKERKNSIDLIKTVTSFQ